MSYINDLERRIKTLEERLASSATSMTSVAQSVFQKSFRIDVQPPQQNGIYKALCVQTIDPLKVNAVQFYNPLWSDPDTTVDQLPYARAISSLGGFDDSGVNWIPPLVQHLLLYVKQEIGIPFII